MIPSSEVLSFGFGESKAKSKRQEARGKSKRQEQEAKAKPKAKSTEHRAQTAPALERKPALLNFSHFHSDSDRL